MLGVSVGFVGAVGGGGGETSAREGVGCCWGVAAVVHCHYDVVGENYVCFICAGLAAVRKCCSAVYWICLSGVQCGV